MVLKIEGDYVAEKYESVTLQEWVEMHPSEEERRTVFLNLDNTLKYIHDHGYCVDVFYPTMIDVLNNQPNQIRFRKLEETLSEREKKDPHKDKIRDEKIREDLFRSSFNQIGIYSNTLKYLTPEFLKDNFDSFIQFLPEEDINYYRGIIQRNAKVYFYEYDRERRNRELNNLNEQLGEGDTSNKGQMVKSNGKNIGVEPINNDRVNNSIYRQINVLQDAAFIHILIIPTTIIITMLILAIISWITSFLF